MRVILQQCEKILPDNVLTDKSNVINRRHGNILQNKKPSVQLLPCRRKARRQWLRQGVAPGPWGSWQPWGSLRRLSRNRPREGWRPSRPAGPSGSSFARLGKHRFLNSSLVFPSVVGRPTNQRHCRSGWSGSLLITLTLHTHQSNGPHTQPNLCALRNEYYPGPYL